MEQLQDIVLPENAHNTATSGLFKINFKVSNIRALSLTPWFFLSHCKSILFAFCFQGCEAVRGDVHVHLRAEKDPERDGGQHQGSGGRGDGDHQLPQQVAHRDAGLPYHLRPRHRLPLQQGQLLYEVQWWKKAKMT